jgi:hypothetical protein
LQIGSLAGHVLEFHPKGIVVPAVAPFPFQKLLFASWIGKTSPTKMELLVPSVTLAIGTTCMVE